ncbi:FHA domain-containing protein [Pleionea sediminis]|uniref:FHA domain-containing protein n=1 Tax=Pleionea sediminis TaxID=2569479 RepID=UPI0011865814|nr:FHA domain-containing protein [Pleionea sediminis]
MLKLQFRDKSRPDRWLVDSLITIGSDPSCDIVIDSARVDPHHAELHIKDNDIEFVHKSTTKSSFVNGALIALNIDLKAWDIIKIGDTELELVDPLLNRSPRRDEASNKTQIRDALSDWLIQAQTAPFSGQIFPVSKSITLGRDTDCDIAIPMPHVSRKHAQITFADNKLRIKDLQSANGTFINGERKPEALLKHGDEIRVDEFCFKVIFTGEVSDQQQQVYNTTIRETKTASAKAPKATGKYPTPQSVDTITDDMTLEKAFFHGKSSAVRGKLYEVESTGSPIGRMLGHHLSREDTSVSGRHVEVFKKGRFWSIKNNGAANGLLVNSRMTTRATLVDGDEVTIGGVDLIFQAEGDKPNKIFFEDEKSSFDFGMWTIFVAVLGGAALLFFALF